MAYQTSTDWSSETENATATSVVNGADDLKGAQEAEAREQANAQQQKMQQSQPQQQAQQPYYNNNTYQDHSPAPKIANFVNMLSKLETQVSMSEEGRKYYEKIRMAMTDKSWGYKIDCLRLTDPAEGFLFYSAATHVGIVLVFTENILQSDDEEYITKLYGKARQSALRSTTNMSNFRVINVIGVGPEDYGKVDAMITDLKNYFIADTDQQFIDLTIDDIDKMRVSISMNIDKVQSFINANSPHGVPAAMDYGFTVDVMTPVTSSQRFTVNNNNRREYETRTIAAITGKTSFLCNIGNGFNPNGMMNMPRDLFLPVVTITDIVSAVKSQYLLPLFLSLAHQVFIGSGLWKQPYKQYGKIKSLNIGNLLEHQGTHQLLEMSNDQEVESFIAAYCKTPIMALGVSEGRSRILGLEWFSENNLVKHALSAFNGFFKFSNGANQLTSDPVVSRYAEYIGPVTYSGLLVDSRNIDYLRIVADNPNEAPNVKSMLQLSMDPGYKIKIIRNISPDYKTKYIVMNCVLRHDFLTAIGLALKSHINVQMDVQYGGSNFVSLDALINESNAYASGAVGMMGPSMFGGYNYMNFFGYNPINYQS